MATPMKTFCKLRKLKYLGFHQLRKYCKGRLIDNMSKKSAWENHYKHRINKTEDWFLNFTELQTAVMPFIHTERHSPCRILDLGCGLSSVGLGLYENSAKPVHIVGVDFSKAAVDVMTKKSEKTKPRADESSMSFKVCDVTQLPFDDQGFDLILDKGTLDAVLRDKDCGLVNGRRALKEAYRVLVTGGSILQFTDEDPECRLPFIEEALKCFNVSFKEIGCNYGVEYFMYVIRG